MHHLNRLCVILPADSDEVDPPPPPPPPSHHHHHHISSPSSRKQEEKNSHRRISTFVRKSLHYFCTRRRVGFCRCPPHDHEEDDDDSGGDEHHHHRRRLRRHRRRRRRHPSSDGFEDISGVDPASLDEKKGYRDHPRIFSYAELYIGSCGFSEKEVLGTGGYGRVYRAVLPSDGTAVAVKCVAGGRGGGKDQFQKTFAAELAAVAQLRHRNLVRLRGWCVHDRQLLLVYDYMPNSSLDRLLFGSSKPDAAVIAVLGWERRRRIVAGLAAALFYLHEQLDTQIIHRDVKASNVMLDAGYNARLGDFGLARWIEHGGSGDKLGLSTRSMSSAGASHHHQQFRLTDTSRIGGTIGYLPPESLLQRGGRQQHPPPPHATVTAKSDVFSFGVVVLEVVTGRRAVDLSCPDDQIFLLDWIRRLSDEGRCLTACDGRLPDGSYPLSGMQRLIHLGLLCSLHDPNSRPTMKWVMETLSDNSSGELPALPSFQSHPNYISLSSSSSTGTGTAATPTTSSSGLYATASNSTIFLTAKNSSSSSSSGNDEDGSNKKIDGRDPHHEPPPDFFPADTPREIPFKEILAVTNNFSEAQMVAEMDFGTAYYGHLDGPGGGGGVQVLVKRLGMKTCPALRSRFSDELRNLGRLRHRHLVQLRGWCTEQGEMLVVYDYSSSRGLLSHHLFRCGGGPALPWRHRYSIVRSLASAVLYLHEEWDEQVIHRSITSSAVFLDPDKNPRLGSFALAEFLTRNEHGHGHHHHPVAAGAATPSARGIFGYMAPEYITSGEATPTADVYSFGVVILEVVTGRMAVDFRCPEVLLVKKVRELVARRRKLSPAKSPGWVELLVDPRLGGGYDRREVTRLVQLGQACTRSDPKARPRMRHIASILDGNDALLEEVIGWRRKEGREEWEGRNASSLSLVRRIQALGIQ